MEIGEFREFYQIVESAGFGMLIGGIFVFFLIKFFLPEYFASKAKNLATKEDIGAITDEIEQVKASYGEMLEEVKSNHQLKLASIEREKSLKKEVYLEGVVALSSYHNCLALLSNLDVDNKVISDLFTSSAAKIAKISLVGSEVTVEYLNLFAGEVAASYMSLSLERMNLSNQKSYISLLESFRQKHIDEVERCLSVMKKMNLDGVYKKEDWVRVEYLLEEESKCRDKISAEIEEKYAVLVGEQLNFTHLCMSEFFRVGELAPRLLLSIRAELDLNIDEDEYMRIHSQNTKKGIDAFETFLQKLHSAAPNV